ncbi:hypothetical protein JCM16303_001978 [Sporobolomyces ruberrimus]
MSRYAERRMTLPPTSSSRYERRERSYSPQSYSQPTRGLDGRSLALTREADSDHWRDAYGDNDDDDEETVVDTQVSTVVSTAVGTDLSALRPPVRGRAVSFGANEVEEFNGSEAPEAVRPAPSSRMENRLPLPPNGGNLLRAVPINRPPSRLVDEEQLVRRSPASRSMPPPPPPSNQRVPSRTLYRESGYSEPQRFYVSNPDFEDEDEEPRYSNRRESDNSRRDVRYEEPDEYENGDEDDDDDAFTAVADSTVAADSTAGTGVASDLSLDWEPNPRRASAGDNTRPAFPSMRSSPAPVQVHRPEQGRYSNGVSASGFDSSYFNPRDERDAPSFSSMRGGGGRQNLAPPSPMQRPRSTGSLRDMQVDGDSPVSGIRRRTTPSQTLPTKPPPLEDSPAEKELIGLLKASSSFR